jgi:phosphopentomutase
MSTRPLCALVVLDSVGIGEAPDAAAFGDVGADTLGHTAAHVGGLDVPNLRKLGLGNIARPSPIAGCGPIEAPAGAYGRMRETAHGKDTATGHWEFMGLVLDRPFRTYPDGFPDDLIEAFLHEIGLDRVLGNEAASGTEIIARLGEEHVRTGDPIVYTSADPVFQIAAHTDVVPLETLYDWCEAAYHLALLAGLSRVIARPFTGEHPYTRTHDRRDYALPPPRLTYLDELESGGVATVGIGKIPSIYAHRGVEVERPTRGNDHGVDETLKAIGERTCPFVFTNLVDFDSEYGHRRNPEGYARCLEAFDARLPELMAALGPDDLLLITADHGNDPTYRGTDHTREYVPLLAWGPGTRAGVDLGTRATFADLGRTIVDFFGVSTANELGTSFWPAIRGT